MIISININAQCSSRLGIMNESCASLTIIIPPALEVSIGLGLFDPNLLKNILKVDVCYITKDEIVYGGSIGVIPNHPKDKKLFDNASVNLFIGYNLAGCIIIGPTLGLTNITTARIGRDGIIIKEGIHANVGMSIKFISTYTSFPITFGAFGSSSGIGLSIGTIF